MASESDMTLTFLEDGRQPAEQVAAALIAFLDDASATVDIAIYDCALSGQLADTVADALRAAGRRGVQVRIAYNAAAHENRDVVPQSGSSEAFLQPLDLSIRPIKGFQSLMHHKYVVRDANADAAAVWTGSTNWTSDAWEREENAILQIPSRELAAHYLADFEDLWNRGKVENTGKRAGGDTTLSFEGQRVPAHVWFCPGGGVDMSHDVARAISAASRRIVIASPVLTDGPILGALADVVHERRVPVRGVYDRTQMEGALHQWETTHHGLWKIEAFRYVAAGARLAGKRTTPYAPGSVHDYMHVKIMVVDDTVFIGSYNFSRSGEENAENVLRLDGEHVAEVCASFVDRVIARYSSAATPGRSG